MIYIVKLDLNLGAALGHDGYDYPGSGDWFHYVHHRKFNKNFGTYNAFLDYVFGSFDTGEELYQ
jgi:sterol desaturase/sphingolipid hydroxylase (fatty acid hydroxylase superfamily)